MVRHFVKLAAVEHAPRYLRFLGMITLPSGRPVRRCQTLVLSCLTEKEEALQLFNNEDELAYREQVRACVSTQWHAVCERDAPDGNRLVPPHCCDVRSILEPILKCLLSALYMCVQLVEDNDHINHPRGELAYHIELIGLLARCIEGAPPNPVVQLRSMIPFSQARSRITPTRSMDT